MSLEFEVPIKNAEGKEVDRFKFDSARIDTHLRFKLIKEALVMYQANKRQGNHSTRGRSEIAGSTRKPWRQKGTGRARAGSRKSPIWRGGGVVFGPVPRDHGYSINKKQRRLALRSAFFGKFRDGEVHVIDQLQVNEPKTREVVNVLKNLGIDGSRVLIGLEALDKNVWLAARNIEGLRILPVSDFNALDVLHAKNVLLSRAALSRVLGEAGGDASADKSSVSDDSPASDEGES